MIRKAAALIAAVSIVLCGCRSAQPGALQVDPQRAWSGPLPAYEEVARAYNRRVDPLTRLSVAIVLRLSYHDVDGVKHEEQVEGRCDFVRPRQVLLRLDKVGQTIALLGSNRDKFWWIELADNKRALIGEHDKTSADRLAEAGVPVHPLDLVELMGFTPIPTGADGGDVSRSDSGVLQVTLPGRIGSRRLLLTPEDFRPFRVELLGDNGKVIASANLTKYVTVAVRGAGPEVVRPVIATDVVITAQAGATQGHLELSAPELDPSRPKAGAFDLDKWLEAKGISDVVLLNREATPSGR